MNTKEKCEVFNFWKDNRTDGLFQLNKVELIEKFTAWIETKEADWLIYYNSLQVINEFIASKDGLSSVGNSENNFAQIESMMEILRPIINTVSLKKGDDYLNNVKN